MISNYVNKLMENLPCKKCVEIDLILGGGAFNGSYLLGALFFLKEMERRGHIIVRRISGCSVSSILAILYLTDNLERANEFYFDVLKDFKEKGNFSKLFEMKKMFSNLINDEMCKTTFNKRLYICYNNVYNYKKRVISNYTGVDHLFEIIIRSSFVPFMVNYNPTYKGKYIDGIIPYIFKSQSNNRKRIYIDLYTIDKLIYAINVKNEKNNYHRLFEGLIDIHNFFIKDVNTIMCKDLDKLDLQHSFISILYFVIERLTVYYIGFLNILKKVFKDKYEVVKPHIEELFKYFVRKWCF